MAWPGAAVSCRQMRALKTIVGKRGGGLKAPLEAPPCVWVSEAHGRVNHGTQTSRE